MRWRDPKRARHAREFNSSHGGWPARCGGGPVAFVWTKCDVAISEEIEDAVREAVLRVLPTALEFSVSVMRGGDGTEDADGLLAILQWIVSLRRPGVRLRDAGGYQMAPDFGISRR